MTKAHITVEVIKSIGFLTITFHTDRPQTNISMFVTYKSNVDGRLFLEGIADYGYITSAKYMRPKATATCRSQAYSRLRPFEIRFRKLR